MTNFNRNGAKKKPVVYSDQVRACYGKVLCLRSISKDRKGWTAEIVLRDGRALGTLKCDGKVIRPFFKVSLDTTNRFAVDIGTGSGVKVAFQTGSNVL